MLISSKHVSEWVFQNSEASLPFVVIAKQNNEPV